MNKRSFLKSLLVAAVAPSVLIPQFKDSFKWKRITASGLLIPNPDWINATYEIAFTYAPNPNATFNPILFKRDDFLTSTPPSFKRDSFTIKEAFPIRIDENGDIIPPYKYA